MNGYFYAFADEAECQSVVPGVWGTNQDGNTYLDAGCVQRSTRQLVEPTYDESGEVVTPGTLSEPFVILSPVELPDASAYQITPVGDVGFA